MKRQVRHYTEEELLLHVLGEQDPGLSQSLAEHLDRCSECSAVVYGYSELRNRILEWRVEEPAEESWADRRSQLMQVFRADRESLRHRGFLAPVLQALGSVWAYALDNPLAAMGYIAAVAAFASERTITLFRLDHLLPNTNEVLEILRQVL